MIINLTISVLLYATTIALLLRQWLTEINGHAKLSSWVAAIAVISHAIVLYPIMFTNQGIDIGFFNALSFTAWLMATLLAMASFSLPIGFLGILVYPFAASSILLLLFSDQHPILSQTFSAGLEAHILFSLLAYCLLSIAVAQALLLYIQDKYLHNKHPGGFLHNLPALETMENILFRIMSLGVISLSISLFSGFVYLDDMFAQHLVHKTILSIIAWAVFMVLLWGRYKFGWRGKIAIKWSISGFTLLMLAYFGSKFVIELILQL